MVMNESNKNGKFAIFLMVFVMLQPLLDLTTSFTLLVLNMNITPGIIIRFLIMLISAFYILFAAKEKSNRKFLYYLIALVVFFSVHLGINFFVKEQFSLISELKSIAKIVYYIEMLIAFIIAFKDLKAKGTLERYFPLNVSIAVWIINLVIIVSTLTGTGIRSYNGLYKNGHSGWFFAANELGTLLAIVFPIILWTAIKKTTDLKKSYHWIPVVLTGYSLFSIGTKVGFLAVLIGLSLSIVGILLSWVINKSENTDKNHLLNIIILIILTIGTTVLMPYLPAFTNTTAHLQSLEKDQPKENGDTDKEEGDEISSEENLFGENEGPSRSILDGVVYSGRDGFLTMHQEFFDRAPLSQKVFGMGYAGNYEETPKIIERDFHDIYYQFGFVGFILLLLPLVYYGVCILITVIKNISYFLSAKYILIAASLTLGLGIAYLAGHMLSAPAVSTYFSLILGYLLIDLKIE